MSTLVNRSGDDEFYIGSSLCSAELGVILSLGYADVYCPPKKRARVPNPFLFEEHTKKPSIDVLPDECLFEIFRRLPGGRERSASACVSKRWLMLLSSVRTSEICGRHDDLFADKGSEIGHDGHLTRSVEGEKATDIRLAAIAIGTSRRGGLGKLSVRGRNSDSGITSTGLSAIARGCPDLKALSLWNVPSAGDEGLFEISKECHSLEKLDLCHCPSISSKGLVAIAERCPGLTSLTIESCPNIGNEGLQAIGRHCTLLQMVTIKDCPLVGDQGVATLMSLSPVLTRVKLRGLKITDFSLAVIGHYGKAITSLALGSLYNVSEKGFWVMGNAQGLKTLASLTITSCRGTTDVSLDALGKGCPNLKQMCLRKCCFVSDHGLVGFTNAAAGTLESLQLEECNRITQHGVLNAVSNCHKLKSLTLVKCISIKDLTTDTSLLLPPCKSLKSLSIRNCPGFGSTNLVMVGKLCPQLLQLDLSGLCGITDSTLVSLLESSVAGLVKVNLSGCLNLSDEVVFALSRLHGQTLKVLNLDGCRKITNSSLVALADSCPFLNDLDVSKCSITDSGICALSRGVQVNMEILSLSGCSMLSSKSVSFLGKLGKSLLGLNLQQCSGISSSAIELLVEKLWRCDILS
ncbi:hypothetical protein DM860_005284 [Cuscuta australis]|uniref:F-box domain-containing protein n=1 Tax=Cuscuta australis TaxID=267555 RepID=A0A328E2C8_9ASTE|nr:hypothetical protein DM860_005284 [Cuscuta australis]